MSLSLPTTTNLVLVLLILYATLLILDQISQLLRQRHDAANVALTAQLRESRIVMAELGAAVARFEVAVEEVETKVERAVRNMFEERAAVLEKTWELMGRGEDFIIEARVVRESPKREGEDGAATGKEEGRDRLG